MTIDLCPEQKQLHDFVTGRLPEYSLESIAEHLETCGDCDRTVATMENEADSFVDELKCPSGEEAFLNEPEFRKVVRTVETLASETSGAPPSTTSNHKNMLGQYMLVERLGAGGMGAVYKALHTKLEKFVAVKILRTRRMLDDRAIARFEREMKAVGKLKHDNIVQASDAGEADGRQFLVMEYIEGAEFSELIRRHKRLSIADACELVRQAAVGLQHAFDHGLVHRDIKPSNLMLTEGSCVKVLDLGLARYADERFIETDCESDDAIEGDGLTHIGQIMGTTEYIAPEQASNSHEVDIRADVYGLGCTLFALLAGAPPFPRMEFATTKELVRAHQTSDRPSIQDARNSVPPELARIVNKMLAIDPNDRFSSPVEIASALKPFTNGANLTELLTPTKAPAKRDPHSTVQRGRVVAWASTLTICAFCTLVAIAALSAIFSIKTPHGTVEIQTDDKNVEISVKQGGEEIEIINAKSGWRIRLKEGKYDVDLKGAKDKFKLDQQSITVTRDGKVAVRVMLKEAPPAKAGPPEKAGPSHLNLPQKRANRRSYMLKFDGKQTYMNIPNLRYDGSHPITIEATVMSLYRGSIIADFSGAGLGLSVANGFCAFQVNDRRITDHGYVRIKSKISVGRNKLIHIAGVLDGSEIRLFVDGKLQGAEKIGKFNPSEFPLMIGADPGGQGEPTEFMNGIIDELRVSKTARYGADYAPPSQFKSDEHTMVLYQFDEGEGDVAHDASGNGRHAKIHAARWVLAKQTLEAVDLPQSTSQTAAIKRLRQIGVKITEKNGVAAEFAFGNSPKITDADMALLGSLGTLENVVLIGCRNVTDAGFAHLRHLPRLQQLNLSPSNIGDAGLANVKDMKDLWMLGLNGTRVTDAGLMHLIDNRRITVLYLNNTKIGDNGLAFLEQMKDMYWMDLENTLMTDVGLARLGHMSKMKLLSLGNTGVTDAGLPRLARFANLELLALNKTAVTDAGAVHLAKLPSLKRLILSDTRVTDAGLIHLAKLKNLTELQLLNTHVTKSGVDSLRDALPECEILYNDNSSHPAEDFSIYGKGAAVMKWASTLETGSKNVGLEMDEQGRITSVAMGGGMMTDEGLRHLGGLKDVQNLTLSYTYGCSAEGLKHVQQMTKVKFLRLWGNDRFSDGVGYLSGMTNVETLYLHKLRITDENMKFVKGMKGCKLLQMTLNPTVTDKGIAHLAGLTELESVYLTCPKLTDECLKYFLDMHKLNSLLIASPHVTKAALRRLSKSLPNLKKVNNESVEKLFEDHSEEQPKNAEANAERMPDRNIASSPQSQRILGFVPRIENVNRDKNAKLPASRWLNALDEIRNGMAKRFPKMALKQDYRGEHGLQHLIYRHGGDAIFITLKHCKTPHEAGESLRMTDQQMAVRTTADIRVQGIGDEAYVYGTPNRTGTFVMCYSNVYALINSNSRDLQTTAGRVIVTALATIAQRRASNAEAASEKRALAANDATNRTRKVESYSLKKPMEKPGTWPLWPFRKPQEYERGLHRSC